LGVGRIMNRVGVQNKYNYRSGTYTIIKFMLLQSKIARRLRIDLIVEVQQTVFGNYIQKNYAYCNELHVLAKKRGWMVEQRRPGMGRSKYSHKNCAYT
jgi:hypothetical protein